MPLTEIEKLAHHLLTKNTEFDFPFHQPPLAVAQRFDGSLKVIAANGQKFIFPPKMVQQAKNELKQVSKPAPKAPSAPKKPSQNVRSAPKTAPRAKKTG